MRTATLWLAATLTMAHALTGSGRSCNTFVINKKGKYCLYCGKYTIRVNMAAAAESQGNHSRQSKRDSEKPGRYYPGTWLGRRNFIYGLMNGSNEIPPPPPNYGFFPPPDPLEPRGPESFDLPPRPNNVDEVMLIYPKEIDYSKVYGYHKVNDTLYELEEINPDQPLNMICSLLDEREFYILHIENYFMGFGEGWKVRRRRVKCIEIAPSPELNPRPPWVDKIKRFPDVLDENYVYHCKLVNESMCEQRVILPECRARIMQAGRSEADVYLLSVETAFENGQWYQRPTKSVTWFESYLDLLSLRKGRCVHFDPIIEIPYNAFPVIVKNNEYLEMETVYEFIKKKGLNYTVAPRAGGPRNVDAAGLHPGEICLLDTELYYDPDLRSVTVNDPHEWLYRTKDQYWLPKLNGNWSLAKKARNAYYRQRPKQLGPGEHLLVPDYEPIPKPLPKVYFPMRRDVRWTYAYMRWQSNKYELRAELDPTVPLKLVRTGRLLADIYLQQMENYWAEKKRRWLHRPRMRLVWLEDHLQSPACNAFNILINYDKLDKAITYDFYNMFDATYGVTKRVQGAYIVDKNCLSEKEIFLRQFEVYFNEPCAAWSWRRRQNVTLYPTDRVDPFTQGLVGSTTAPPQDGLVLLITALDEELVYEFVPMGDHWETTPQTYIPRRYDPNALSPRERFLASHELYFWDKAWHYRPKQNVFWMYALTDAITENKTTTLISTESVYRVDVKLLLALVDNLSAHYDFTLMDELPKELAHFSNQYCITTPTPYAPTVAKCYVCGMEEEGIPRNTKCNDAFENAALQLLKRDLSAESQAVSYRKLCRYRDQNGMNISGPSAFGRWSGGCSVRWVEMSPMYTQRTCRSRTPIRGYHLVSRRMAGLEKALLGVAEGCVVSPAASLTPLSRGVSLYARYHACVCASSWCNRAATLLPRVTLLHLLTAFTYFSSH